MKKLVFVLTLLAGMVGLVGCGQVKDEDVSRPWVQPEPWERNVGIGPFGLE